MTPAVLRLAVVVTVCTLAHDALASKPPCRRDYGSPLLNAVADRRTDEVKALLAKGADPNEQSRTGRFFSTSALRLTIVGESTACRRVTADVELFKLLVSAGADLNAKWPAVSSAGPAEEHNALQAAAYDGDVQILRAVLDAGAPVDARTNWGRSALLLSVSNRRVDAVTILLQAGANPNLPTGTSGSREGATPLHHAARWSGPDNRIVKTLIAHGAKYRIVDGEGPFFELARFHREPVSDINELIDLLIQAGGSVNEGEGARTPLNAGIVSTQAPKEVIEALLRKGANPNAGALYVLATRHDYDHITRKGRDVLRLLLRYGARPELTRGPLPILEYADAKNSAYASDLRELLKEYSEDDYLHLNSQSAAHWF